MRRALREALAGSVLSFHLIVSRARVVLLPRRLLLVVFMVVYLVLQAGLHCAKLFHLLRALLCLPNHLVHLRDNLWRIFSRP